jgi:hypothetical protein
MKSKNGSFYLCSPNGDKAAFLLSPELHGSDVFVRRFGPDGWIVKEGYMKKEEARETYRILVSHGWKPVK